MGNPSLKGKSVRPEDVSTDPAIARLEARAAALLDGSKSWGEVWGALLVEGFEAKSIASAFARLDIEGNDAAEDFLAPANPSIARQVTALGIVALQEGRAADSASAHSVGRDLQASLSAAEVVVFVTESDLGSELAGLLRNLGITKAQTITVTEGTSKGSVEDAFRRLEGTVSALAICATRGRDRTLAEVVNRAAIASGVRALYHHARGLQVQVGPLVIPRQTACFECFRIRRDATLAPWERTLLKLSDDGGLLAVELGLDWVMVDTVKLMTGLGEPVSRGRVLFVDYQTGLPEVHTVLRLPRCSVCGGARRPHVRLWN